MGTVDLTRHRGNRHLDDSELDSADDEDRRDRVAPTVEDYEVEPEEDQVVKIYQTDIGRMAEPELSDGDVSAEIADRYAVSY